MPEHLGVEGDTFMPARKSIMAALSLMISAPSLAVTHDEFRDGKHNTFLVRNGPTGSNHRFMLDPGVNVFTGVSDCSSIPRPDYVGCGEMFDFQFWGDHHITGFHLWLWDEFEEFYTYQPTGSTEPFFTIGLRSTYYSNTDFSAGESFTLDEAYGAEVRGERLFSSEMPVGLQYFDVGIDNPDGSITVERWPSSQLTVQYDSPSHVAYRMEIHLNPVPELNSAAGPLALGLLLGCFAWRRERERVRARAG